MMYDLYIDPLQMQFMKQTVGRFLCTNYGVFLTDIHWLRKASQVVTGGERVSTTFHIGGDIVSSCRKIFIT